MKPYLLRRPMNRVARLFLSADYKAMFSAFFKELEKVDEQGTLTPKLRSSVDSMIAQSKQALKSNNAWMVWWLRWYRLSLERTHTPKLFARDWQEMRSKNPNLDESDVPKKNLLYSELFSLRDVLKIGTSGIKSYRPEYRSIGEVRNDLSELEEEWRGKQEDKTLNPHEGDYILIDLGGGWAWWFLNRNECSEEAKAMGHCGNAAAGKKGQYILSLRKEGTNGQWEPHLTFILDANGYLGEMKGNGNDKPAPKYYPYIIKLLENPIVKGIKGGGYAPERNFDIDDLPEEDMEKLYEVNPPLMPLDRYYEKYGLDELVIYRIQVAYPSVRQYKDTDSYIIQKLHGLNTLTFKHGNSAAINGGFYIVDTSSLE